MNLTCINCSQAIESGKQQAYQGVIICPTCFDVVSRLVDRAEQDMQKLLLLYKETLRVALCEQRLSFGPAEQAPTVGKKEVLEQMLLFSQNVPPGKSTLR